jgi:hypothetical protein
MLDALQEIAVWFSCFLAHQVAPANEAPKGPVLALPFFGDPLNAFVRASRALHLAMALAFRIENEIDALRASKPLGPEACISQTARAEAAGATGPSEAVGLMTDPDEKDREMALQAIVEAAETLERPKGLLGRFNATFRKNPGFDRLLNGPLRDAVAAICADLGLKPDWSLWTEDGFPPPFGGGKEDWIAFFVPEGKVELTPTHEQRELTTPPPRRDGHFGGAKAWRPSESHDPLPRPYPAATRPPDRATRPDDPVSRSHRASLLGTAIIAGAPRAAQRASACLG